ncbi:Na(+)/H(+) exchange regulatory cofactor NHE-RF1 [Aphelenchoides besseyi]|nr:Na(+)/H(+) exchange regulatory cofactor NHE-RF1 [Aphelenchoides besseyi]
MSAESPRICLVRKAHANQEYGFNLHAERSNVQYVGAVDAGSPADVGGLKQNDRIIGINGVIILGETHKEVVQRIKTNPMECEMLVISPEGLKWHENHGIELSYNLPNIVRQSEPAVESPILFVSMAKIELKTNNNDQLPPRKRVSSVSAAIDSTAAKSAVPVMSPRPLLCHLRKQKPTDEFGFNLHAERNKGHFIGAVDKGGIADLAGLETGQRIVGVNGELIYATSLHKEVVALIKRDPLDTRLLVASEEVDRWYTENNIPYSFDLAIVHESARQIERHSPTIITQQIPLDSPQQSRRSTMYQRTNSNSSSTFYTLSNQNDVANNTVYVPEEVEVQLQVETPATAATAPPDSTLSEEVAVVGTPDDLMEQVFRNIQPPEVTARRDTIQHQDAVEEIVEHRERIPSVIVASLEAEINPSQNHYETPIAATRQNDYKHVISNHVAPLHIAASSPAQEQPPVTTYTPTSQFGTTESPHSEKRSLNSPDSHKDENVDIFKLSAKEARQLMKRGKRDPRVQAKMTLEEKHQPNHLTL